MRKFTRRWPGVGILATMVLIVSGSTLFASAAPVSEIPGARPAAVRFAAAAATADGLQLVVNERGHVSKSIVGFAGDNPDGETRNVTKPAGATLRKAYLAYATTGFTFTPLSQPLMLDGRPVPLTGELLNGISSYNYFADVTPLLKARLDAAPAGPVSVTVAEPEPALTEGEILEIIYDDPAVTVEETVSTLYGALSPTGDSYRVQLATPISLADPATRLEMSLGISYSYQESGSQQYSTVEVNGRRLTTSAGGEDDGLHHNGALLTVGDDNDSATNPADPQAGPTNPRSDDERYDLRPFVSSGDTTIQVTTANPSLDDNVFLATFTMNPPVSQVTTGKPFVYVALGDSYSSGEGAGFDIHPQANYLEQGYENGHNFPDSVGPQENTYTMRVSADGNACHRALVNYAKINKDKYSPGSPVTLIDRTCSGATIEPGNTGDKPPIVGAANSPTIDPASQVRQALDQLAAHNMTAADVDLVTVGMGGNDAHFGDIVAACALPALFAEVVRRYPNPPPEAQAIAFLGNCQAVDQLKFHTDNAISQLAAKEIHAAQLIVQSFPNARVLQVDYPNILPRKDSPAWCGGLRGGDVGYARTKIKKIDSAIRTAVATVSATNPRLKLVEQENTFGPNALCPSKDANRLANGLTKANVEGEVARLLNLDGHGDATARAKLDALVTAYRAWKKCVGNQLNPIDGSSCDVGKKWDDVNAKVNDLMKYLQDKQDTIFGNIVSPPGSTDDTAETAFDRSRGLFHPNANGFAVQACNVLDVWNTTSSNCVAATAPPVGRINGQPITNYPVTVVVQQLVQILLNGFQALTNVHLRLFSEPVDLVNAQADADGTVNASFTMPALNPGVHTLEVEGVGAGGVKVTRQVLLTVPGRPTQEYTSYLCCFTPEPATIAPDAPQEQVEVSLGGIALGTYYPDEYGGILVQVPTVDRLRDSSALALEARSSLTGQVVRELINPIPAAPSLWATSSSANAVSVVGSGFSAAGRVHSEGGVQVLGSDTQLRGGTEYATTFTITGGKSTVTPPAVKTAAGQGAPPVPSIADYRPGGVIQSSGQPYRAIPTSACRSGTWTPTAKDDLSGVVYVPCGVALIGNRTYPATIAAEGPIVVAGTGTVIGPTTAAAPSLITASSSDAAIVLIGSGITIRGTAYAINGKVTSAGNALVVQCGIVASRIALLGSRGAITLGPRCLA